MSIQIKRIGKQEYKYEVTWDEKEKKQKWRYIGKVTNDQNSIGKVTIDHKTIGKFDISGLWSKLKFLFFFGLGLSILAGLFTRSHPYFWWDEHPAFFAIYGFIVCVIIITVSRILGHHIKREVDYYD